MTADLIPPMVFYAVDQAAAEAAALAWALTPGRHVRAASVTSCERTRLGESRPEGVGWHVVLEVEWDTDPEQRGLWE